MAYGRGRPKHVEKRMAELAAAPVDAASPLADLRRRYIDAWRRYGTGLWPESIWRPPASARAFDAAALEIQKNLTGSIYSK